MLGSKKIHRAWMVCFGLLLMQSGVVGVYINCNGIIFSAILEDLGFRAGDLSVAYTIRNMVSAAAMGMFGTLYFKCNSKLILTLVGTSAVVSLAGMAVYNHLWQWYVSAVLAGIGMGGLMIILPMVLNNWFKERIGFVIGLVAGFSGIAGAICSPICSNLIGAYGWRVTTLILAGVCVILVILPAIFLVEASPELVQALPYGQAKVVENQTLDIKHPQAYLFTLLLFVGTIMNVVVLFINQLPTYAISVGHTLELGAIYTSWVMVGNVVAKVALGILADKIGIYKAMLIMVAATTGALGAYWLCADMVYVVCVASFFLGAVFSITIAAPPLALTALYGRDNYRGQLSKLQSVSYFVAAILAMAIPYSYDLTGHFNAFFVLIVLCGIGSIASVVVVQHKAT